MNKRLIVGLIVLIAVALVAWRMLPSGGASEGQAGPQTGQQSSLVTPALSAEQSDGKSLFDENCAACHGASGAGTDQGPPLIHPIYEPGHHGDQSFVLAALNGARAHHWRFGDMPPVDGVDESDVLKIVSYIRAVQRANGID
ncbi:c-type cytochrome [Notoacmeibacter sp. MSK16QG-6]|uniref:c-type cytochrome n=1 Tax=Notoacmeibacter sp. MSK16QG-6 TaxID=2957982 RepID=UPI00209CA131|nr:c-type cytochrome [Notoacmeibacter sp. MSK16QG-6]MCP1198848.1 cytochrome c [Notoacmeibacter sp. MSK16QG-6]